ncbi:hypothetical protein [Actinomadura monticuli]|uniref:Uncharacterized protein n=1 Tax=Actinomadura monticuli TaxID=3097367 RepID=A0ABV4QK19_9ACTN
MRRAPGPGGAAAGGKVLTALAVGSHLPARLLAGLPVTATTRAALGAELSRGWLALHAAARHSAPARAELTAWMLDDEVVDAYAASVAPLVGRAHCLLDLLGGEPGCVRELHGLVDETVAHLPRPRLAVA